MNEEHKELVLQNHRPMVCTGVTSFERRPALRVACFILLWFDKKNCITCCQVHNSRNLRGVTACRHDAVILLIIICVDTKTADSRVSGFVPLLWFDGTKVGRSLHFTKEKGGFFSFRLKIQDHPTFRVIKSI